MEYTDSPVLPSCKHACPRYLPKTTPIKARTSPTRPYEASKMTHRLQMTTPEQGRLGIGGAPELLEGMPTAATYAPLSAVKQAPNSSSPRLSLRAVRGCLVPRRANKSGASSQWWANLPQQATPCGEPRGFAQACSAPLHLVSAELPSSPFWRFRGELVRGVRRHFLAAKESAPATLPLTRAAA